MRSKATHSCIPHAIEESKIVFGALTEIFQEMLERNHEMNYQYFKLCATWSLLKTSGTGTRLRLNDNLASANYKLQILPPGDVILGEKSIASRLTNGINGELEELKEFEQRSQTSPSIRKLRNGIHKTIWLLLRSLSSIGAFLALYYWKLN
uniref:Uncharacterized protein n=1 Tax=Glossina austeni TaxID=7395 RepID=A0A1A9UZE0_GLOAU